MTIEQLDSDTKRVLYINYQLKLLLDKVGYANGYSSYYSPTALYRQLVYNNGKVKEEFGDNPDIDFSKLTIEMINQLTTLFLSSVMHFNIPSSFLLENITDVYLRGNNLINYNFLLSFPNIEKLVIIDSKQNSHFESIQHLTKIKQLSISGRASMAKYQPNKIQFDCSKLSLLNDLERLQLNAVDIKNIESINSCKIKELSLTDCQLQDVNFFQKFPIIEEVHLSGILSFVSPIDFSNNLHLKTIKVSDINRILDPLNLKFYKTYLDEIIDFSSLKGGVLENIYSVFPFKNEELSKTISIKSIPLIG
jgi:hypothetical protein